MNFRATGGLLSREDLNRFFKMKQTPEGRGLLMRRGMPPLLRMYYIEDNSFRDFTFAIGTLEYVHFILFKSISWPSSVKGKIKEVLNFLCW